MARFHCRHQTDVHATRAPREQPMVFRCASVRPDATVTSLPTSPTRRIMSGNTKQARGFSLAKAGSRITRTTLAGNDSTRAASTTAKKEVGFNDAGEWFWKKHCFMSSRTYRSIAREDRAGRRPQIYYPPDHHHHHGHHHGHQHAVPCRAVPCRAVPCRAVPCRAVPCRAVPCFPRNIPGSTRQ